MRDLNQWLRDYQQSHQDPFNIKVHKICVPAIIFSLFGILWHIKIPIYQEFDLNLLFPLLIGVAIFYKRLGDKPFIIMMSISAVFIGLIGFLNSFVPVFAISIVTFVIAWIFQFIGHRIEGKKPSFFEDLKFLLIGPLWVWMKLFGLKESIKEKDET